MTSLTKPVTRQTDLDPRLGRKCAGPCNVTLYPDGSIGFRRPRSRKETLFPLSSVYAMALKAEAVAVRAEKKKGRRK